MRCLLALFALSMMFVGCTDPDDGPLPDDLRRDFPAPPDGALAYITPEYVIPAGTEKQMCWIFTYEGGDVGITTQTSYQSPMGHHVAIFGNSTPERDLPEGHVWDCTELSAVGMGDQDPIIIGGSIEEVAEGNNAIVDLPDGMAAQLKAGQRIVVQSHYVNVRDTDILVQDAAYLEIIAEEDVEVWAAPWVATEVDFVIPDGVDEHTLSFDCEIDEDMNLLYLSGHMHDWGVAFRTEWTRPGEAAEIIYDIPEWEVSMRDAPPYNDYGPGEFVAATGDVVTTTCTWFNHEGHDLDFPQEMCVTFGMAYPLRVPWICEAD